MGYNVEAVGRGLLLGMWTVGVRRSEDSRLYWVDVWLENDDLEAEWNQSTFGTSNEDKHRQSVQSINDEFDAAASEAICFLEREQEIIQFEDGTWHCNISEESWY